MSAEIIKFPIPDEMKVNLQIGAAARDAHNRVLTGVLKFAGDYFVDDTSVDMQLVSDWYLAMLWHEGFKIVAIDAAGDGTE